MSISRPCTCDRFQPGKPFVEGRDCSKCWMFAHRPIVRQVWGGDPSDCDRLFAAKETTPAEELADLLAEAKIHLPHDWQKWPSAQKAHLILAERFLERMPPYAAGQFEGRGAVICGGGPYEPGIYVACKMLREVGWDHPIQIWHRGKKEPLSDRIHQLSGVELIDSEAHPARTKRRTFGGWQSKSFAILHSRFEDVLFMDADVYPVANPDVCFQAENNPHGIVTWPGTLGVDQRPQWFTYGLDSDGQNGLNGGHYAFIKSKAWPVLQLAGHYDNHSDFYYCRSPDCKDDVGGFSDEDQMRAAIHKLKAPSSRYASRPLKTGPKSFLQAGPDSSPLFVHRLQSKFALPDHFPDAPGWHPQEFPMEATAWHYFLEWLTKPTQIYSVPDEVPGWFSPAECELWQKTCKDRNVLELGRYLGRSTCAAALSASKVVSIDRDSEHPAEIWLQRYGVRHKVWLRRGDFADLVPSSGGPFSACLIDGEHDKESVERDIATVMPHLAPGARIGFHDYADRNFPDVQVVVDHAAKRFDWKRVERSDFLIVFEPPSNSVR